MVLAKAMYRLLLKHTETQEPNPDGLQAVESPQSQHPLDTIQSNSFSNLQRTHTPRYRGGSRGLRAKADMSKNSLTKNIHFPH